jgi:hypothetical protein
MMLLAIISLSLLSVVLTTACQSDTTTTGPNGENKTFTGSSKQPITYNSNAHEVLIRTFYGGGLQGSFSLSPQISLYGDGTYIFGLDRQGKLSPQEVQQLLNTLVNTYGLLNFSQQHFSDIQDENATFMQLLLNGKQQTFVYGSFGHYQASAQKLDEYQRLGKALTTLTETLKGPTQPYKGSRMALLVRQTLSTDPRETIPTWPLSDFTLDQAALYECGTYPRDETTQNQETPCLRFVIPARAILLTSEQAQRVMPFLRDQQGDFSEQGLYYRVILRPLLPDELSSKTLAMFGSAQTSYRGVPLLDGKVPPITPTPSG